MVQSGPKSIKVLITNHCTNCDDVSTGAAFVLIRAMFMLMSSFDRFQVISISTKHLEAGIIRGSIGSSWIIQSVSKGK